MTTKEMSAIVAGVRAHLIGRELLVEDGFELRDGQLLLGPARAQLLRRSHIHAADGDGLRRQHHKIPLDSN